MGGFVLADALMEAEKIRIFPTRKVMQKYLSDLAWETEAWCSDIPDHMIHLDGEKFMGPYRSDE